MRSGFKKIEAKFKINKSEGIVKCTVSAFSELRGFVIYTGISKCKPGDIFDEVRGKKLASCRAQIKMYRQMEREAKLFEKSLLDTASYIEALKDTNKILKERQERRLKSLL